MMKYTKRVLALLVMGIGIISIPQIASAYLLPEEVLLSDEFVLPPRSRESEQVVRKQARESAKRREEEQELDFARQHPFEDVYVSDDMPVHGSAPEWNGWEDDYSFDGHDLKLLETVRLLERIEHNQEIMRYGTAGAQQGGYHAGAPLTPRPLAHTGMPLVIATFVIVGALFWTLKRAGKRQVIVK